MSYSQSEFNTKPECVPQCAARDAALYSDALVHAHNGCNQARTQNVIITPPPGGIGGGGPFLPPTFPGEPGLPGKPGLPGLNLGLNADTITADTVYTNDTLPSLIYSSGTIAIDLPIDVIPGTRVVIVQTGTNTATVSAGGAAGSMVSSPFNAAHTNAKIAPGSAVTIAGEFIFLKGGSGSFWVSLYQVTGT